MDAYFAETIPMQKVNYLASDQFESLRNFKLLQSAFNQLGIPKDVNIQKLSKGSQSELLEFLQYLYKYLTARHVLHDYDAFERRRVSKYGGTDKIPLTSTKQLESNFKFYTKKEAGVLKSGDKQYYAQLPPTADMRPESARQNSKEWYSEYGKKPFSARYSTGSHRLYSGRKKPVSSYMDSQGPASNRSSSGYARSRRRYSEEQRAMEAGADVPPQAVGTAVDAAGQAVNVLRKSLPQLRKLLDSVGLRTQDSYASRGKVRSMQDAMGTLIRHTQLLLKDLHTVADAHSNQEVHEKARKVEALLQELHSSEADYQSIREELAKLEAELPAPPSVGMPTIREETPDFKQLDAVLKAIGAAHASLSPFTGDQNLPGMGMPDAGVDGKPGGKARAYKFGEYQIRKLKNGDVYKGKYVTGKKNGEGVYSFLNGDVYEGNFKEDQMEGYGVYTFAHQGRYEGHWSQAVYDGAGMETFAKGSTYHGEYSKGMRHGYGVCRYFNGDYYEGQWASGLREGRGMQQCTDDSNYVGDYSKGRRHGYGVYSFPNNDQYLGEYERDIPHGYGVYVFASGQKYEGEWKEGKKHGWCEYTVETGERYAGLWEQGQPKWVQSFSDIDQSDEAVAEETKAKITNSQEAAQKAKQAAKKGSQRAEEHWSSGGDMQKKIHKVVEASHRGALEAQKCRQKALEVAAKLEAMAEEHIKGTSGQEDPSLAQELEAH